MSRRSGLLASFARAQRQAAHAEAARRRALVRAARELERAQRTGDQALRTQVKELQKLYVQDREAEAKHESEEIQERTAALNRILAQALASNFQINLDGLKEKLVLAPLDLQGLERAEQEPRRDDFVPVKPSYLARLWPGGKETFEKGVAIGLAQWETACRACARREQERKEKLAALLALNDRYVSESRAANAAQHADIEDFKRQLTEEAPSALVDYCTLVLESSPYPDDFARHVKVGWTPESKQMVVESNLPPFETVPVVESYRYVKAKDEIVALPRSLAQRRSLYASVIAQFALRSLYEVFRADRQRLIAVCVFNGFVEAVDPASGQAVHPCLVTVRVSRDAFDQLNLPQVEPAACLRALNAGISRSPSELAPVRPIIDFSMIDPRFIEETDVLSSLDQRPNLMELTPSEFESLITNLFEKMGLETRLTQASRDGGVDCVPGTIGRSSAGRS